MMTARWLAVAARVQSPKYSIGTAERGHGRAMVVGTYHHNSRSQTMKRKTTIIGRIGKILQDQSQDLTQAPLPERWVELLRRLKAIELSEENASMHHRSVSK
jgi:hypothetical protein